MTERRVLIASILSALFLAAYAQMIAPARPVRRVTAQPALTEPATVLRAEQPKPFIRPLEQEEMVSLESPELLVEIGARSGAIRRVTLKRFLRESSHTALQVSGEPALVRVFSGAEEIQWAFAERTSVGAKLDGRDESGNSYHIIYSISSDNPLVYIELIRQSLNHKIPIQLVGSWAKTDTLSNRYNQLETFVLSNRNDGKEVYRRYLGPVKTDRDLSKDVPRGTKLLSLSERYFCESIRPEKPSHVSLTPISPTAIGAVLALSPQEDAAGERYSAVIYFGPRDYFSMKRAGFHEAFPVGALGQIGLVLLMLLRALAGVTKNYGLAIIAFSGLITAALSPFTLLSFRSMKKMQELKPHMDKIMAQHKDDPKKANQEMFALYKAHRVSPLSGCLPMLLQIPIFIALFQAISHFVDLRGKSFLWIADLSLPDRMARLPISLPILGSELNALPIIMAVVMYVQTKFSTQAAGTAQANPTAQMMSGPLMPILFGVMFYQFPSGLVLYWLTNSLMSLAVYRLAPK